jgi:hypothetical protein
MTNDPTTYDDDGTDLTAPSWDEYDRAVAGIATEMIGARRFYDANPAAATDARLADVFRTYTDRLLSVPRPAGADPC